mgnify:FL=1
MKNILYFFLLALISAGCEGSATYEKSKHGIILKLDSGILGLEVFSEHMVRLSYAPLSGFSTRESLVVVSKPEENVTWHIKELEGMIILETALIRVEIEPNSGMCRFTDAHGKTLLVENGRRMASYRVMDEDVNNVFQSFELSPEEALYGLGQHQDGIMNWRGQEVTLVQTNVHAVIPFLVSTNNYGILWDNCSKTIFKDDDSGASFWSEVADQVDYYFIAGNNMDEVIDGYRTLTGVAPMFGKWAYGYWQSKERYVNAEDLMLSLIHISEPTRH